MIPWQGVVWFVGIQAIIPRDNLNEILKLTNTSDSAPPEADTRRAVICILFVLLHATRYTPGGRWANVGRRVKDICHKRWLRNKYRCCYTETDNWVCSWLVKQTILFQYTLFLVQNMKNTNGLHLNQHLKTKSYVRLECANVQYQYLPNW